VKINLNSLAKKINNYNALSDITKINASKYNIQIKNIDELGSMDLNEIYNLFNYQFEYLLPELFKIHRIYFTSENRGFGEKAFHSMWFNIFGQYQPRQVLEIGVYRGQTLSLFNLLQRHFFIDGNVYGISPLSTSGDEYSDYNKLDYEKDITNNFKVFQLSNPKLIKGYSNDKEMIEFINSLKWDLIYVDGSHDYEIVKSDINVSIANLNKGGILVLDDASLYLNLNKSDGMFKGHPGPSLVADELALSDLVTNICNVGHNRIFIKN